jgi:hypothetical protein
MLRVHTANLQRKKRVLRHTDFPAAHTNSSAGEDTVAEPRSIPESRVSTLLGSVAAHTVCTYRDDDANEAAHHGKEHAMKIVPTSIEEHINRVDRSTSLGIGIATGLTALWCVYRLIWLLYTAVTFSSVGWSPISLVFPFIVWGAIGVVAAIASFGFLTRYAKET